MFQSLEGQFLQNLKKVGNHYVSHGPFGTSQAGCVWTPPTPPMETAEAPAPSAPAVAPAPSAPAAAVEPEAAGGSAAGEKLVEEKLLQPLPRRFKRVFIQYRVFKCLREQVI